MSHAAALPAPAAALALGLALAALALPGPAAAEGDCPRGLARDGVWFDYGDRSVEARVRADGLLAEVEYLSDGTNTNGYLLHPVGLLVESWSMQDGLVAQGSMEVMRHEGMPDPMPAPTPGLRLSGTEVVRYDDGTEERAALSLAVGGPQPFVIGPCTYSGLPVTLSWMRPDGSPRQTESMIHLTELGLTVYLGFADGNATPLPAPPISISHLPPGAAPAGVPAAPGQPPGPPAK
jgi:hypothetical protein